MKAIEANWYNLLHGATVGMFGYIVSNSLNVALVTFCGATLLSCVIFTKELTKEDRSNLKIGIAISFIIMAGVTIGQLIIPDSAVKGEPIHSALFTIGFLLFFTAICISERINTDLMHAIYNWIGHIRAYHIKGSHWYDLLFGVIVGVAAYVISNSALFTLIAFGIGTLISYATEFITDHDCFGDYGCKMYCHFCSEEVECHDKKQIDKDIK